MEIIYFTVAAIGLYLISDWIVNLIERKRGERLQNRSVLFFVIIFTLAVLSFGVIQKLNPGAESGEATTDTTDSPTAPATSPEPPSGQ